ncbi:MAG: glycosyltransferase [Candidatus Tenebribacter davisii]|jgi:glycosyltransferase involved in cell wall biosynthesis|nr:glycosyltransferase [Candidatus Tenebribacter davisii]
MRIHLASYQSIMLNRGGPTYKLLHLKKALEKLGVDVKFFDMWDFNLKLTDDDLVHIFLSNTSTFSLANNLKLYGAKYVVNPIIFSNHPAWKIKLYQTLEKPLNKLFVRSISDYRITEQICNNAEKVLPNTVDEGNLLVKGMGVDKNKIQVIHNGVEKRFADASSSLFQKKYGLKNFILYVGHLGAERKNGVKVISALQQIDHPSVIIADILHNQEGEWCRAEINKSKNIKLIEWLNHDDPLFASAYAACHTFILPTKYETPGRSALEAGLAGANIVITPNGGTKEYFGDLAEYPNPHLVSSIQKAIQTALNKPRSSQLSDHIKKNFVWSVIAKETLQMYKSVLNK